MTLTMRLLLACLLSSVAAHAAVCPPQPVAPVRFASGEKLAFRLDVLGADVGTFDVTLERAQAPAAWSIKSHARTSAFVSSAVKPYDAFVAVTASREFLPLHLREDVDEGEVHKSVEADFTPQASELNLQATVAGKTDAVKLPASADARELMTSLYLIRAQPMKAGSPICVEAYAGRRMWKLEGTVAARETIDTPLGRFATMRIDATASRVDDPNVKRAAHVWVSDDDKRLPLVAIGEVRGKTIRAQMVEASSLPKRRAQNDSRRNAIGR